VDDFFPENILNELLNLQLKPVPDKSFSVHHNYIGRTGKLSLDTIPESLAMQIHSLYFNRLCDVLDFLCPGKKLYYDYTELHLVQTGTEFSFPIHHDLRKKLLSVVVYLDPPKSSGTNLFKNKNQKLPSKVVDWRPNRALLFCRRENTTWHSYQGSKTGERRALVYNLMTNRPLAALRSEGSGYYNFLIRDVFFYAYHRLARVKRQFLNLFRF